MPRRSEQAGVTERGSWRRAAVVAFVIGLGVAVATPAVVAAAPSDDAPGTGIGVEVLDESGSPSPAPSSTLPTLALDDDDRGSRSSGGGGSVEADGVTVGAPSPMPSATSGSTASGLLELSGLRALGWPTWDPFDSTVHASLTVRNGLASTVSARVRFEMRTVAGQQFGKAVSYKITNLRPGETRQLDADLRGAGQSTLVRVASLVTPITDDPASSKRTFVRDAWVLVPPWLLLVVVALLVVAAVVVWVVRRNRRMAS
jgi:hypothetical protein